MTLLLIYDIFLAPIFILKYFTQFDKIIINSSGAPANAGTNPVGVQSEGEAEGGCGGNSASPERQFRSKKFRAKFRISHQSLFTAEFASLGASPLASAGEKKNGENEFLPRLSGFQNFFKISSH